MTLLREYGANATSMDRVLAHSGAPHGSVYHHFPGGRTQLIDEAVALAGDLMTGVIDAAMQLELKTNYIRAAHTNGQTLTATGTVIHSGRRTRDEPLAFPSIHQLQESCCGIPAADGHLFIERAGHHLRKAASSTLRGEALRVDGQISLPHLINAFSWRKDLDSLIRGDAHQENGI